MDPKQLLDNLETQMNKALSHFIDRLATIRAARLHPSMLNAIRVNAYGDVMKIDQVAAVSILDSQTICIKPWDKALTRHIEAALSNADLGLSVASDTTGIVLKMLPITEESRKRSVHQVKTETEHAKVLIRKLRQDAKDQIKKNLRERLDEDDIKRTDANIQKITDSYIAKLDNLSEEKNIELLKI